jgi:hypothetical protein
MSSDAPSRESAPADKLDAMLNHYYEQRDGSELLAGYHQRHSTASACILTVTDDERAAQISAWLEPRIAGKVVVEIGAGLGLLAMHMAQVAKRVYAIEVDPAWTSCFLACLYAAKPTNLTFIFGRAEDAPPLVADVALFCTHSGHDSLYHNAARFAPQIIDVYAELLRDHPEYAVPRFSHPVPV